MVAAAIAASSAHEMVLVKPTPLGFIEWDTFKQGWFAPDPVSCPSSCFFRLPLSPVPPILYFTDQVRAGAVLGRFVRALRPVLVTCFILGSLWGLMKLVAG